MCIAYVVAYYDSPLTIVSAIHHVDLLTVLGANEWTSEPASEQD